MSSRIVTGDDPYRQSRSHVRPRSLRELFATGVSLDTGEGLALWHRILPWKRRIVTVCYRPDSLASLFRRWARDRAVLVEIVEQGAGLPDRWRIAANAEVPRLLRTNGADDGSPSHRPLSDLEATQRARVQIGPVRFALASGELRFTATAYDIDELAEQFTARYPWSELGLPPLLDRTWVEISPQRFEGA